MFMCMFLSFLSSSLPLFLSPPLSPYLPPPPPSLPFAIYPLSTPTTHYLPNLTNSHSHHPHFRSRVQHARSIHLIATMRQRHTYVPLPLPAHYAPTTGHYHRPDHRPITFAYTLARPIARTWQTCDEDGDEMRRCNPTP
jgi:hypothetical protein